MFGLYWRNIEFESKFLKKRAESIVEFENFFINKK